MDFGHDGFTPRMTGVLFLLLAGIWGTAFVAIEIGLHHFPPLTFAGLRYLVAGAIVIAYARMTTSYLYPRNRRDVLKIAVFAVFFIFGNHAFLYLGEQYVSGAIAAVVVSLSPILTAVFASLLLDDGSLHSRELVGFLAGVAGVVVIAQPSSAAFGDGTMIGVGLVFVAALSFALGAVLSHPIPTTIPLTSLQGWSMLTGATMLMVGGTLRGESLASIDLTTTAIWTFVYLTIVSGAVAFLLYFALLEEVGPADLNLVGYLEPVGASLVGWALLGDLIGANTVGGFVLIFAGFAFIKGETLARRFGVHLPSRRSLEKYV
ncbi:Permease of the drug/metabolite transporter (DMT) superfamily [Halanaeroarchaeum sp. HSR-CO]|uniref:DMT family transporter n=1 Tax=Halanaeroarchaeum sp. HSR-CO TaxID=2866382 RepID=UPI00217DA065|nr:EamA family transporter [Halanaeroarchaeum sp. HSR-CO]UWG47879.1 Permease of the drug/metabolite transporter (DMT) superfamily [Halanaeroarchaeum sp. HSR-CO]